MFEKKTTTIEEQIALLKERGLTINNLALANHSLSHISYYRLGEYWYSMQDDKEKHLFKANSIFEDVIALYSFDAELRILLFDVIEKIEISLRTKLIYHLSHESSVLGGFRILICLSTAKLWLKRCLRLKKNLRELKM